MQPEKTAHEANCVENPGKIGEIYLNFDVLLRFKVNLSTLFAPWAEKTSHIFATLENNAPPKGATKGKRNKDGPKVQKAHFAPLQTAELSVGLPLADPPVSGPPFDGLCREPGREPHPPVGKLRGQTESGPCYDTIDQNHIDGHLPLDRLQG